MRSPVFVQNEQEFLRAAEREGGDEAAAAAADDVVDSRREPEMKELQHLCTKKYHTFSMLTCVPCPLSSRVCGCHKLIPL